MTSLGIALDLGTSGFRAQAIDLDKKKIISTSITRRHPFAGANVIDHLQFALEVGENVIHGLMIDAVNRIIKTLGIELRDVRRLAVSGNPTQLSIFENIEIRDLAYAGKRHLERLGVTPPSRNAKIVEAGKFGLEVDPEADVYIPPAIKHEVGADALAMMVKSKFLETNEIALVTDYGTNAEIALKVNGEIYTASCAAGPAIEGQHIERGMLASPGAISDIEITSSGWRCYVLDDELNKRYGDLVDPRSGLLVKEGELRAKGITGTGVVAAIATGMRGGVIGPLPKGKKGYRMDTIDGKIHFQDRIFLSHKDFTESGKAFGAFTAGHISLTHEAGIKLEDVEAIYMAGAAGTYVDPIKAQQVGLVPTTVRKAIQVGNTSLAMACDIVKNPETLDKLQELAKDMQAKHVMFAESPVFKYSYIAELGFWLEAMPFDMVNQTLKMYGYPTIPEIKREPEVIRIVMRDIPVFGEKGLRVVEKIGVLLVGRFEDCSGCRLCEKECPEDALSVVEEAGGYKVVIGSERCDGMGCKRCQKACPLSAFKWDELQLEAS